MGDRLHDGLRHLKLRLTPPNPLKSEAGAFGFLLWFVSAVAVIVVVVLIIEAL
ncbi:MAG TPA: hypothetical protein VMF14_08960 [Solirubrobacteraceae bacterium]|nr:hypothetical protein [Solirubrobacteraceae bacterium]